jgi:hypothetical protein
MNMSRLATLPIGRQLNRIGEARQRHAVGAVRANGSGRANSRRSTGSNVRYGPTLGSTRNFRGMVQREIGIG